MDENGTGVMTYTVTVDGHAPHYENAGYGEVYGGPELEIWPSEDSTEDTGGVWPYTYLDEELSNDSEAHLVAYFGTPGEADYTDTSLYIARLYTTVVGEDEYHSGEEVVNYDGITIQLGELLPAVTLTAENGDTMSVSSVGMRIDCGNVVKNFVDEYADADTITIHYADGTEYVVRSDEYDNTTGDMVNEDCTRNCCIFNRLVDTESIESVSVIFDGADDSTQEVVYS